MTHHCLNKVKDYNDKNSVFIAHCTKYCIQHNFVIDPWPAWMQIKYFIDNYCLAGICVNRIIELIIHSKSSHKYFIP